MNQTDYKAIAEIINKMKTTYPNCETQSGYFLHFIIDDFANDLADYFEKESNGKVYDNKEDAIKSIFDKEQFLKDCGVKE